MCMLSRRLQILIDDDRYTRLATAARERGASIGELVRDAIDSAFPEVSEEKMRAGVDILEAEPMSVPNIDDLRRELEHIRAGER